MFVFRFFLCCFLIQAATSFSTSSGPSYRHARAASPKVGGSRSIFKSPITKPVVELQNSATTAAAPAVTRSDRKKRVATGMSFLTGWADVFLFLKYKTFATMMTGNLMWLATATVEGNLLNFGYYSSVIASYLVGVSSFRRMDLSYRKKCLRLCSLVVGSLFIGSDVVFSLTKSRWIPVMMLAAGFGVINSIGTEVAGTLTFVVTGHMTRLTHMVVDRFSRTRGRKPISDADKEVAKQNSAVLGGFFGGALFACFLKSKPHLMPGVFSMLGLGYGLLFNMVDMESLGGAWWLRIGKKMCELDDDGEICDIPEAAGGLSNSTNTTDIPQLALAAAGANATSVNGSA